MAEELKKFPSFTKEKAEILRKTLGRFDNEITVNPLDLEESIDISLKDHTFLVQVLLETFCFLLEDDPDKRKILFNKLYKSLGADEALGSVINVDNLISIRRETASRLYFHIQKIHHSISSISNKPIYELQKTNIPISNIGRYEEAFDEIKIIARGGFGTVCKARHKIDSAIYAVKKIIFVYRNDSDYVKVMREVRNLSSLKSKYVVAYNNAWVQPVDQDDLSSDESSDSSENLYIDDFTTYNESEKIERKSNCTSSQSSSNSIAYNKSGDGDFSHVSFAHSYSESSSIIFQKDSNDSQSKKKSSEESCMSSPPLLRIKMMLCIQMEFCDYDLRHWLNARSEGHSLPFSKSNPQIFKEILCGVAYIHGKEIIHRDLKPQNIFFSSEKGVMKVGDFGLATLNSAPSDPNKCGIAHSTNLGTLPYAAPEQRSNSVYDSKVDMYSLGIILMELLVKTETKMEFYKVIDNFKKGIIAAELEQEWPEYVPLLKNLLEEDHNSRMNALQVLDMPLFKSQKTEGNDLEQKVKELRIELANKEAELANKEAELANKERMLRQNLQLMEQKLKKAEEALLSKGHTF